MNKDKIDNKEQIKDNKQKIKKSTYSKKKKIKKNIINGIAYVQSTFNNTIVSIADTDGNIISWASAGGLQLDKKVLKVHENQHLMLHKLQPTLLQQRLWNMV